VLAGRASWPFGLLAALALAAPVLVGLGYSALAAVGAVGPTAEAALTGASLERVGRVLTERAVWSGVLWSIWIAGAATGISTVLAMLLAVVFRTDRRLDRVARALALLPLPIPHIVAAVLAVLILGQSGLLARSAHALGWLEAPADMPALIYDPAGIGLILALVWKETPFLALVAFSVLARPAVASLEETARTLGGTSVDVFRRVAVPVLWRGMLPAAVAVFAFAVGSYEAAALLAPSDPLALPLLMMERHADASLGRRADAFVLVLLAMAIAFAAVALHERVRRAWSEFQP
jgi:putative spermidine/putrescine transport system permease protein